MIAQPRAGDPEGERDQTARISLEIKLADMDDRAGRSADALKQYQRMLGPAEEMALENCRRAIEIDESILAADPNNDKARSGLTVANKNLGDHYFCVAGDIPRALRCYRRVAELLESQARADPGNLVARLHLSEIRTETASCLSKTGHVPEARREALLGLAIAKELADRPGATPEQVYNYAYLAIYADPEDLRDAAAVLPYALKAVEMNHGSDPFSLHVLAQTYARSADYQRAIEADEKALARYPPAEPGKPVTNAQQSIQHLLKKNRRKLKN